ncbi:MAG: alginate export family protein, partial [bacterium]|nr:alginate export family protein [bacterium]
NSADDVEVQQAYIQVEQLLGQPLRLRIGRQDLKFGKGWLIGNQISPTLGLSYDAIRLTYDCDVLNVDAVWAKLAERSPGEEDGDVDLYAIYATYKQLEAVDIAAYWFWVRDGRSINDTNFIAPLEWVEDVLGLDNYDVTNLHTFGIRVNGAAAGFDYDLEVAYQTGEADAVGAGFVTGLYGDDGADFDAWAADLEVGYTMDIPWRPRVYVGGAYFGGEDNRDLTVLDWVNPFYQADASVSFNRLFSMKWYSASFDLLGGAAAVSNFTQARGGITVHPTESVSAGLSASYTWVNEEFDAPVTFDLGAIRIPVAPALAFWTDKADDDIGLTTHVWVKYDYSDDLFVKVGWEHLFTGSAMEDGSFIMRNGLDFSGGSDKDEADYIYFDTCVKF